MRRLIILIIFSFLGLTACATEYRVVQIPLRNADLYPRSLRRGEITVAVDGITDRDRVMAYFGVDLIKEQILPINIIVSNHGNGRYIITPSDVLLLKGNEVIDPMPVETVLEVVKELHGRMSDKTTRLVTAYFSYLALQETMLAPRESHQGVLFFKIKKDEEDRYFIIKKLFRDGSMKISVGVMNLETGERFHFDLFL
jgi:hypothetical protein